MWSIKKQQLEVSSLQGSAHALAGLFVSRDKPAVFMANGCPNPTDKNVYLV